MTEQPPDPDDTIDVDEAFGDDEVDAELDRGYSPPEKPLGIGRYGETQAEEEAGESLDQRLAQEEPDPALDYGDGDSADVEAVSGEVGTERAGRLVAPDEGLESDTEKDLIGSDVGIDAGAASAEEAAVHVVDEDSDVDFPDEDSDDPERW